MKKLLSFASLAGSMFLSPFTANAGVVTLYDIDFSAPTHAVGSAPTIGTGSDKVSGINFGTPMVGSTFGGFANQSLHFDAATSTYEQIELNMGQGYDNYQLSFDFFSTNLAGSKYSFTLFADTPKARRLDFHGKSGIFYDAPFKPRINGGSLVDNASYNVLIDYDLLAGQVSIWLNGGLMGGQAFSASGDDIESFRFRLSPWRILAGLDPSVSVNLDNIKVTSRTADIPEPTALLMLSMGLIGLASVRKGTGSS